MLVSRETGYDRRGRVLGVLSGEGSESEEADSFSVSKCREPETEIRVGSKGCKAVAATASNRTSV